MNRQNLAIHAILNSVEKTSEDYSVDSTEVRKAFSEQSWDSMPLIQRLRLLISNKALSTNIKIAATQFGLSTKVVQELLLDQVTNDPCALQMMYQENKSVQTLPGNEFLPQKRAIASQASDGSHALIKKLKSSREKPIKIYSTQEKFNSVRDLKNYTGIKRASDSMGIPIASLKRWKEKIKNDLFQSTHIEKVYSETNKHAHKDKFFVDVDKQVYEWYVATKNGGTINTDEMLMKKATELASVDGDQPTVAPEWISEFKKSFKV